MEVIPEDLKADLRKVSSVEVILGHTFRVWHNGRTAKDYWVRILRNIYLGSWYVYLVIDNIMKPISMCTSILI